MGNPKKIRLTETVTGAHQEKPVAVRSAGPDKTARHGNCQHRHQGDKLVAALKDASVGEAAEIGEVLNGPGEKIWVR